MDFTPETEDEVIREAVSHKLYRPLVNTSKKIWRKTTKTKTLTSPYQIGDSLRYTNEWHNDMVELVDINTNDPDIIMYSIKLLRGKTMIVNKESLKSRNVPDIGYILIYPRENINE